MNSLKILKMAHAQLLKAGGTILPAKATLFAQAIQLQSGHRYGFDFSPLDIYRWRPQPEVKTSVNSIHTGRVSGCHSTVLNQ